ncbi:MAG: metallophosphoesterase [Bacteroidales bacterium]|nr:metallophosphoesterase [Bacteroidales bacterium]
MRHPINFVIFLSVFIILVDLYAFRGFSALIGNFSSRQKIWFNSAYWIITLVALIWLVWFVLSFKSFSYEASYRNIAAFMGFFVLVYVPKLLFNAFQLVNDVSRLLAKTVAYLFPEGGAISSGVDKISRSDFLLQAGLIIAAIPFLSIIWGIWKGRYNFKVSKLSLAYPNLPASFDGTRILQISDFHIGSFAGNPEMVEKAIDLINRQDADYILFTGDLVNNIATEVVEFIPILKSLKAKKGKFSILGNHDYGEYYNWSSREQLEKNMQDLYGHHQEIGFTLLRNQSVKLQKDGEEIGLIGVENWGLPPFPQYGDLGKAITDVENTKFKILMSHDPSHWDAEVRPKSDIDLTLSGHTHGMQFAIRIPGWRWSPVEMKYPRWGGLYTEGKQNLYVNIGIGYIAFPGRVGTPPEITVIELKKA